MVHSPVGARCTDCASIGRAPIFRATSVEISTTIALSVGAAILFGIAYGIIVWILWALPLGFMIGNVASSLIIGLAGMPVGDFVRKAGKYKLDARLRIVAAGTVFIVWSVGFTVASMLGVWNGVFMNIVAYIGLAVGVYVAMNRVRP